MNVTYRSRLFAGLVITLATWRVPHVKQDLLTVPEHLVLGGVCVADSLLGVYVVSCVLLFVFLIFIQGVVSLFSIYELDCFSGIFHPSFMPTSSNLTHDWYALYFGKNLRNAWCVPEGEVSLDMICCCLEIRDNISWDCMPKTSNPRHDWCFLCL